MNRLPLLVVVVLGCAEVRPGVIPVSGSFTVNGKPVKDLFITFLPVSPPKNSAPTTARTGDDGRFALSTFLPNDGAPPGEYTVIVTWPESITKIGEQEFPQGDRLGNAYSKDTTPLRVTITPTTTTLPPFEIKTP